MALFTPLYDTFKVQDKLVDILGSAEAGKVLVPFCTALPGSGRYFNIGQFALAAKKAGLPLAVRQDLNSAILRMRPHRPV
jgi:hypothetical protein